MRVRIKTITSETINLDDVDPTDTIVGVNYEQFDIFTM